MGWAKMKNQHGMAPLLSQTNKAGQILGAPSDVQPMKIKQTARQRTPVKVEVPVEVARGFGKELAVGRLIQHRILQCP
jgi:hypothetical protein